jgi:hypothetical protein
MLEKLTPEVFSQHADAEFQVILLDERPRMKSQLD